MNMLYSLREWICDCDRFLFLAEVHYHNKDVVPSKHQFEHEINGQVFEELISRTVIHCERDSHCISFDRCLAEDEFSHLVETLDNIKCGRWDEMDVERIVRSQEILCKLSTALDRDIMKTYESKGFPSLYNICGADHA